MEKRTQGILQLIGGILLLIAVLCQLIAYPNTYFNNAGSAYPILAFIGDLLLPFLGIHNIYLGWQMLKK